MLNLVDFYPRPYAKSLPASLVAGTSRAIGRSSVISTDPLKRWLVRRVECIRGESAFDVEVFPAFNYARDEHTTEIVELANTENGETNQRIIFKSKDLSLELQTTVECSQTSGRPEVVFHKTQPRSSLGEAIKARICLKEGQGVSFVLRDYPHDPEDTGMLGTSCPQRPIQILLVCPTMHTYGPQMSILDLTFSTTSRSKLKRTGISGSPKASTRVDGAKWSLDP